MKHTDCDGLKVQIPSSEPPRKRLRSSNESKPEVIKLPGELY